MTFTLTFAWWWAPTLITVAGLVWAVFIVDGGDGFAAGLANLFAAIPVLIVSLIAWVIAGFMK